jgi:hypothetical protein
MQIWDKNISLIISQWNILVYNFQQKYIWSGK